MKILLRLAKILNLLLAKLYFDVISLSLAEKLVEELEADEKARKRLVKLLVSEAVSESELRLVIINAVLRDVATKDDVVKLREEIEKIRIATKEDISKLEERIEVFRKEIYAQVAELRERVSKLEGAFTQLVERIGNLDKRIDALDKRIDYIAKISWLLIGSAIATLVT